MDGEGKLGDGSVDSMKEAVIEAETHTSSSDKDDLCDVDLSGFDAVFREAHDKNYFDRELTVGYALFAIGHLMYGATYGRSYESGEEFEERVCDAGLPWIEADAGVSETFEMVAWWKRMVLLLISPFLALFMLGFVVIPLSLGVNFLLPGIGDLVAGVTVVGLFGFAWALQYFLLVDGMVMSARDEYMAETVARLSEENDYSCVLVSCGEAHRRGIAAYLREEGWEVEDNGTSSLLGRFLGLVQRVERGVLNPRKTGRRIREKL